jgi:hypothetical protein
VIVANCDLSSWELVDIKHSVYICLLYEICLRLDKTALCFFFITSCFNRHDLFAVENKLKRCFSERFYKVREFCGFFKSN